MAIANQTTKQVLGTILSKLSSSQHVLTAEISEYTLTISTQDKIIPIGDFNIGDIVFVRRVLSKQEKAEKVNFTLTRNGAENLSKYLVSSTQPLRSSLRSSSSFVEVSVIRIFFSSLKMSKLSNETMKESPYKWFTSKLQTNKVEGKRCYLSHQVALQYQFQIYGIDKLVNEHISPYFDKGEIDIEKFSLAIQV